jgi:hypothetical protein
LVSNSAGRVMETMILEIFCPFRVVIHSAVIAGERTFSTAFPTV